MHTEKERVTVSSLEKQAADAERKIQKLEEKIGRILLDSADAPLDEEIRHAYTEIKDKKEQARIRIGEISDIAIKHREISEQIGRERREKSADSAQWHTRYKALGEMLFKHYEASWDEALGSFYADAGAEYKKFEKNSEELAGLKEGLDKQPFWSRMTQQVKCAALSAAASAAMKKFSAAAEKGAEKAWSVRLLQNQAENGALDEPLLNAWNACAELAEKERAADEKIEKTRGIQSEYELRLAELHAENPEKAAAALRSEIDGFDASCVKLYIKAGHEYAAKYISPSGEKIAACPDKTAEEIAAAADGIAEQRTLLCGIRRSIGILELEERIGGAEKSINSMKQFIASNQEKMEKMRRQNEVTADKITEASNVLDDLRRQLAELKAAAQD